MLSNNIAALVLFIAPLVSAHGLVSVAAGNLGGKGLGLDVLAGGTNNLADVTVFQTGVFGATSGSGAVDPNTAITTMIAQTGATIPQISTSGGIVNMTYHQINADGAGPVSCSVSSDATGKTFTPMTITTNVPGNNGRSTAADADFPLVANMPAGIVCTGTVGGLENVCIVKCANPVGPFGSNIPVQMSSNATAAVQASPANITTVNTTVLATGAAKPAKKLRKGGKKGGHKAAEEKKKFRGRKFWA